jgi:hypothetical protein
MAKQAFGVGRPIHLNLAGEIGHRVGLNTDARYPEFGTFYECCSRPTEWIQDDFLGTDTEACKVFPNEMRRKGKHKAVPVVRWAISRREPVRFSIGDSP